MTDPISVVTPTVRDLVLGADRGTVRPLSLSRSLILVVALSVLLPALAFSGIAAYRQYSVAIQQRLTSYSEYHIGLLAVTLRDPLSKNDLSSARALLDTFIRNPIIVNIQVFDNAGHPVLGVGHDERRRGTQHLVERPIESLGIPLGSVRLQVAAGLVEDELFQDMLIKAAALCAQLLISSALILWLLNRRLLRPLQQLGQAADRLALGELDAPICGSRDDEIGRLTQRLEETRLSLKNLFGELAQKNRQLQTDIEERAVFSRALSDSESRYRALVEQSPIAVIEWDLHWRVMEWNPAAERIFGYAKGDALGRHASFIIPESARAKVAPILAQLVDGSGGKHSINENTTRDGRTITCEWHNGSIRDESGRIIRIASLSEDITERRLAERSLHVSEAKFAAAFHGSIDPIGISDVADATFVEVNEAFERMTGYTRQEAVGRNSLDLGITVDPVRRQQLVDTVRRDGFVRDFPIVLRNRAGELLDCLQSAYLVDIAGTPCLISVVRDVTEELRAERALQRLAQGSRLVGDPVFFQSLVTDLASALGTDWAFIGLLSEGDPGRVRTLAAVFDALPAADFEYTLTGSPSERVLAGEICVFPRDVLTHFPTASTLIEHGIESYAGAPIRNPAGRTVGVLAIMHGKLLKNVELVKTLMQVFSERASAELERQRSEEALRLSERRFSAIFHASPVAIGVSRVDADYALIDVNDAWVRQFARERHDVIGKSGAQSDLWLNDDDRRVALGRLGEHGELRAYEAWMRRGDGKSILCQVSGSEFALAGDRFVILVNEDITEKRRIEREVLDLNASLETRVEERTHALQFANTELAAALDHLQQAQHDLVRSEKLAALGAMVAGVAHELNTPIGNSLMVASTLIDQTRTLEKQLASGLKRSALATYVADARTAGDILVRNLYKASELVTSFKQVAVDQTSAQRRPFQLDEVIAEIILTLRPSIRKTHHEIDFNVPPDIVMDSFPGALGQVVTNLINNAIAHAFEGRAHGSVWIAARISGSARVELTVSDDGVGIPQEYVHRIFDPFFTTKLGRGGSGLGLNIVYNIVTRVLGGAIRVESAAGQGSRFIITIPARAPTEKAPQALVVSNNDA